MKQLPEERDVDRSRRVAHRLALIGPGPGAFYGDVVTLAFEITNVRMTLHFVAHALREIESSIRDVLLPRDFKPPHAETQTAEILAICVSLGFAPDDGPVTNWVSLAGRLHQLAHRRALALPNETPLVIQRLVSNWDSVLDPLLEKYESQYQVVVPQLIALAANPSPSEIDLRHLQNDLPNNLGALGVFFDKIQSGAWLHLIEKAGYFENAPPLDYDADAGTVRAPRWPQAEYLARFASYDPDLTVRVAQAVEVRGNFRVVAALLDAVNGLSADRAAQVMPQVTRWLQVPMLTLVDDKATLLVERLHDAGFKTEATEIAITLFDSQLGLRGGA